MGRRDRLDLEQPLGGERLDHDHGERGSRAPETRIMYDRSHQCLTE
jgi:hypothetical protein